MTFWSLTSLGALCSFLVGAIPFGLLIAKLKGVDIRKIGSGNVGAMNVGRALGRRWFVAVFLLDMAKGLAPTIIVGALLQSVIGPDVPSSAVKNLCWLFVGLCAVLGHNYSPFIGFRGGKGVSTSLGVALGVYPDLTLPAMLCFGVWGLGIGLTRMSSVGSISGGLMFPVLYLVLPGRSGEPFADRWPFFLFTLVTAAFVMVRHRANISRIIAGTEARVGRRSGQDESADSAPH